MNGYLLIKTVHILCSVILVGTGFGTAYFLYFAHRSRIVPAIAVVARLVVRADWWMTTPAVIVQPLSGLWLMQMAAMPWDTPWILASLALFGFAGACWLPVVVLQIRLSRMASRAQDRGSTLPPLYWRTAACWERLGYPAFAAMIAIYFLMVCKPAFAA